VSEPSQDRFEYPILFLFEMEKYRTKEGTPLLMTSHIFEKSLDDAALC
jgi:hypothetical protein